MDKLLPKHGFKLLDAQSKRIVAGESVTCASGQGYTVVTSLVQSLDENGKVELRCELFQDKTAQFSTLVKTPLNQLFFCQRALQRRIAIVDRDWCTVGDPSRRFQRLKERTLGHCG